MSTIFLFRHGQTEFNRDKIFTGWLDSPLTPLGRQQAAVIASLLADQKINLAYQTHLSRSIETLSIVLKNHPECSRPITDDRIIERSYGTLAGHSHADIIQKYGQNQFGLWHRGWSDRPPGGESFADVEVRVLSFINDLKIQYASKDLKIAISAHGNSIRLFRKIIENTSPAQACSWTIPYDQYFEYQI